MVEWRAPTGEADRMAIPDMSGTLGPTGLAVSRIGLGLAALGGLARLVEPPDAYWRTRAGLPWR